MKRKLYLAYGSNLNEAQMEARCPDAVRVGTAWLENYELLFRGSGSGFYLTVDPCAGGRVPVGVWSVSEEDERALDRYEGFPRFYTKQSLVLPVCDEEQDRTRRRRCFVYRMRTDRLPGLPSRFYWETCLQGYRDFGFDRDCLEQALDRTRQLVRAAERKGGTSA